MEEEKPKKSKPTKRPSSLPLKKPAKKSKKIQELLTAPILDCSRPTPKAKINEAVSSGGSDQERQVIR